MAACDSCLETTYNKRLPVEFRVKAFLHVYSRAERFGALPQILVTLRDLDPSRAVCFSCPGCGSETFLGSREVQWETMGAHELYPVRDEMINALEVKLKQANERIADLEGPQ